MTAEEITAKIEEVLSSREAKATAWNAKLAKVFDDWVGAEGMLVARYDRFTRHRHPVNLGLLMALTEFLVSKEEFTVSKEEFTTKLDDILKKIDEIKDTD